MRRHVGKGWILPLLSLGTFAQWRWPFRPVITEILVAFSCLLPQHNDFFWSQIPAVPPLEAYTIRRVVFWLNEGPWSEHYSSVAQSWLFMIISCCCCCQVLSCVQFFATPWTVTHQTPLSMEFPSQKYWSGLPFPSPGTLPDPGIKPRSPALQAVSLPSELPGKP